jgi:serine/threonine protein phosphatase PrpC
MGGHKAGEIASRLALEELTKYIRSNISDLENDPAGTLKKAIEYANSIVFGYAQKDSDKFRGMGTTVTAALPREDRVYIAHVGDSRAYLVGKNGIKILTIDHSLVNELVKSGGITEQEAENHPQKNVLTRAIGTSSCVDVDVSEEPVTRGDILILCTDGLSNLVDLDEIRRVAGEDESLRDRARHFIDRALERGGDDNITVVLYQVE